MAGRRGKCYRLIGCLLSFAFTVLLLVVLLGTNCCRETDPSGVVMPADSAESWGVIERVELANRPEASKNPYTQVPYYGDLWATTWAADGDLYTIFGDGTGMKDRLPTLLVGEPDEFDEAYVEVRPGWFKIKDPNSEDAAEWCEIYDGSKAYQQAPYTPAGLVRLKGPVPNFQLSEGPDQDVVARHIPYGDLRAFEHMDKPSSLVAVGKRFYAHMHYPPGIPDYGYLAWSDDGRQWHKVKQESPWGSTSPFRVTMFFNMGQAYVLNRDGYLYGLGIGLEISLDPPTKQEVYLCRVRLDRNNEKHKANEKERNDSQGHIESPTASRQHRPAPERDPVLSYGAYEYFTGFNYRSEPSWSKDPAKAKPLDGLNTLCQGSAMYHPGLDRYLFLSGFTGEAKLTKGDPNRAAASIGDVPVGTLFEAPYPWGPWRAAGNFAGGFIASFIPKDVGKKSVWFAAAGGGGVTYALNIARLDFKTRPPRVTRPKFSLQTTSKVEQVIGDWDFETLKPTRQQTETRFNLLHTDLGASFEHQGKLWFLFGDSDPEAPGWDEYHDDAIAWTTARRVKEFRLEFLKDQNSGRGYLNPKIIGTVDGKNPKLDVDLGALNVPLSGLSDGDSMFVWFTTGGAERSLLARSDDNGRRFRKVYEFGNSHFIDLAAERARGPIPGIPESVDRPHVLVFGSGNKEYHHVYLAAMSLESMRAGDRSAVRFLQQIEPAEKGDWRLVWSPHESDAVPIFHIEHGKGPGVMSEVPHGWGFGEPLVHFNRTLGRWVATYNSARRTIRLRTALRPWGPWSQSIVLFDPAADYGRGPAYGRYIGDGRTERLGGQGELYGPYVIERFTRRRQDGSVELYWLLSPWQPYTVLLMESVLEPLETAAANEGKKDDPIGSANEKLEGRR